jgi:hypothetical protein
LPVHLPSKKRESNSSQGASDQNTITTPTGSASGTAWKTVKEPESSEKADTTETKAPATAGEPADLFSSGGKRQLGIAWTEMTDDFQFEQKLDFGKSAAPKKDDPVVKEERKTKAFDWHKDRNDVRRPSEGTKSSESLSTSTANVQTQRKQRAAQPQETPEDLEAIAAKQKVIMAQLAEKARLRKEQEEREREESKRRALEKAQQLAEKAKSSTPDKEADKPGSSERSKSSLTGRKLSERIEFKGRQRADDKKRESFFKPERKVSIRERSAEPTDQSSKSTEELVGMINTLSRTIVEKRDKPVPTDSTVRRVVTVKQEEPMAEKGSALPEDRRQEETRRIMVNSEQLLQRYEEVTKSFQTSLSSGSVKEVKDKIILTPEDLMKRYEELQKSFPAFFPPVMTPLAVPFVPSGMPVGYFGGVSNDFVPSLPVMPQQWIGPPSEQFQPHFYPAVNVPPAGHFPGQAFIFPQFPPVFHGPPPTQMVNMNVVQPRWEETPKGNVPNANSSSTASKSTPGSRGRGRGRGSRYHSSRGGASNRGGGHRSVVAEPAAKQSDKSAKEEDKKD